MPVQARRFVRKMRGGAQAHLIEGDDGCFYIVKFRNNPQHRRVLVNELISAEILNHLQISSPEYRIINISSDFLAGNPGVGILLGSRHIPIEPGWHFGSKHPGDPDRMAVYDFIPDALLSQVSNPEQFLAVLVFDRWVANADGRQTVFFRAQLKDWLAGPGIPPRKLGFVVSMIDNGFAFGGPHWNLPDSAITGLYPRRLVYERVRSLNSFDPWLSRVANFPDEIFDRACRRIPPEWLGDDDGPLEALLVSLVRRKKRIPQLMEECRRAAENPFPNWPT